MDKQVYIVMQDKQHGPFDYAAVSRLVTSGEATAQSLSWFNGMAGWEPLSQTFPKLFDSIGAMPPPLPLVPANPPSYLPAQREAQGPCSLGVAGAGTDRKGTVAANEFELAGIGARVVAGIIDAVIVTVVGGVAAIILPVIGGLIVYGLYVVLMMANQKFQGTLGMKALGIKVVEANGMTISMQASVIRWAMSYASAAILLIGYLMALFSDKKQTLHDRVAETYVVNR